MEEEKCVLFDQRNGKNLKLLENAEGSFLETESWKKVHQRISKLSFLKDGR